jgi:hypothetical protein
LHHQCANEEERKQDTNPIQSNPSNTNMPFLIRFVGCCFFFGHKLIFIYFLFFIIRLLVIKTPFISRCINNFQRSGTFPFGRQLLCSIVFQNSKDRREIVGRYTFHHLKQNKKLNNDNNQIYSLINKQQKKKKKKKCPSVDLLVG